MLTKNEITSLSLSPTKKDFVQIWNELLEVAGKLSERWDPTSTNESDPGIVILKALTGIADKLNYNIDKNTLEAFMPTAAQEDSMRKLCEMLGYNIKYYQSAKTDVTIRYYNPDPSEDEAAIMSGDGVLIPKFTVITNSDQDINYFTVNPEAYYISAKNPTRTITCMEGQVVKCESANDNNVITANQISENNRFYLPETQIAENGIFIYNIFNNKALGSAGLEDGPSWEKVDNLNIQPRGTRVFKFGFDSYESRPYVEFPEDYSELFGEGIFIYYTRTSGINGNISPRTLTQLEVPNLPNWSNVAPESFSVENIFSATTGANIETIKQAYNSFKKTIGTFETLVTCRDYMNKIYSMTNYLDKPYVSNILVTDIRNDLNRAVTICSCDDAGIFYKEKPLSTTQIITSVNNATKPVFDEQDTNTTSKWHLGTKEGIRLAKTTFIKDGSTFDASRTGVVGTKNGFWTISQAPVDGQELVVYETSLPSEQSTESAEPAIDHFDLVFYPFKTYNQIKNNVKDIREVYDASFDYTENNLYGVGGILERLDSNKTIAHNIVTPQNGHIVSINNYLRLNATIATNYKITVEEGSIIIDKIKIALANAFNMRELDFGEEIPFDSIIDVIEQADVRIRVASLNEPALYTTFSVLTYDENNRQKIVEYAVASDWLTRDDADATGRLIDIDGESSTFDTDEAKKIYNKLAVRNILAGRVPLFNYNNVFKTSFDEGAYQETNTFSGRPVNFPDKLAVPEESNPYTVWAEDGIVYTGQYMGPDNFRYTKTFTPVEHKDNIITTVKDNLITDLATKCILPVNEADEITNVTLSEGEFIKFRAPNFTTIKTYPAYVNYHLDLDKSLLAEPVPAKATSLFEILNKDRLVWSSKTPEVKWQKVLDYFGNLDKANNTEYKKTFTRTIEISAIKSAASTGEDTCPKKPSGHVKLYQTNTCMYCGATILDSIQKGDIIVNLNKVTPDTETSPEELLAKSGCVKLINKDFKARLEWAPKEGEVAPAGEVPLVIKLDLDNPFIINSNVFSDIEGSVYAAIEERINMVTTDGAPVLPTSCSWKVAFDFECVPFEPASLSKWEDFIKYCSEHLINTTKYPYQVLDYVPFEENSTVFWRTFGEGYDVGKYVMENTEKLLKFTQSYFSLLPENALAGLYLIENVGLDANPAVIKNNEEYFLKRGEYLYIEYTPSSTTDDGTVQELPPKTEIYGEGTIIRPSGFELGLMDSDVYTSLGNSAHKTVTFSTSGSTTTNVAMHRFGANEQVEIRDFAEVRLNNDSFKNGSKEESSVVYIYKNFNNCDALEKSPQDNKPRTYTLKDGEYIFYTDANKSELAYFTNGTQVTLTGNVTLPPCEIIDLTTIFDSGLQAIPWQQPLNFADKNAEVIFQEYQYITLGSEDTLKKLTLLDMMAGEKSLSDRWQFCDDVEYVLAGDPDTVKSLPKINILDRKGCGWEVSSILELDVSSNSTQTLRNTEKVKTSLILNSTSLGGEGQSSDVTIAPKNTDGTLSFKTNLACQYGTNQINIKNVLLNPDKVKGFQLKVFTSDKPVIVYTKPNKVVPYSQAITDLANWPGDENLGTKDPQELWSQLNLDLIKTNDGITGYDRALRLSTCLLPDTYGIFCVYLHYTSLKEAKTWIEVFPGTDHKDITLLNVAENEISWEKADAAKNDSDRLFLKPGINCIRVNKTGRFFIKTSSNSQGVLFFDELRLVNSKRANYTTATKGKTSDATLGLNLEQLGYLATSDITGKLIDAASVKDAFAKKARADFAKISEQSNSRLAASQAKLSTVLPDIEKIQADTTALESLDTDKLSSVLSTYKDIKNNLTLEEEILALLEEDWNIETLLTTLIGQLSSRDVSQQQLLDFLDNLKTSIARKVAELTMSEITELFKEELCKVADKEKVAPNDLVKAAAEIKRKIFQTARALYANQITELVAQIVQNTEDPENERLKVILASLQAAGEAELNSNLLTKVNELKDVVAAEKIDDFLTDITKSVYIPDYKNLASSLSQLRNVFTFKDLSVLITEIELAASLSNNDKVLNLVTELQTLIGTDGSVYEELLSDTKSQDGKTLYGLDSIITSVNQKIASANEDGTPDTELINRVKSFCERVTKHRKEQLTDILEEISLLLSSTSTASSLESALEEAISALTESNQEESGKIVSQIKQLCVDYNDFMSYVHKILDLTSASSEELSKNWLNVQQSLYAGAFNDVVTAVWVESTEIDVLNALARVEPDIRSAILVGNSEVASLKESLKSAFNEKTYNSLSDRLKPLLMTSSFEALFDDIEYMWATYYKNKALVNMLNEIKDNLNNGPILTDYLDSFNTEDQTRQPIIKVLNILKEALQSDNPEPQLLHKLSEQLKKELTSAKSIDEQFLTIIEGRLYPNIKEIKNSSDFVEDAELAALVDNALKAITSSATSVGVISSYNNDLASYYNAIKPATYDALSLLISPSTGEPLVAPISTLFGADGLAYENVKKAIAEAWAEYCLQKELTLIENAQLNSVGGVESLLHTADIHSENLITILEDLKANLYGVNLGEVTLDENALNFELEKQLLADIRAIDVDRDFYYNVPIDSNFMIDFKEKSSKLNTLMNPLTNYDINNMNNSFVISKLDIDYLTSGIQIARSSRLN